MRYRRQTLRHWKYLLIAILAPWLPCCGPGKDSGIAQGGASQVSTTAGQEEHLSDVVAEVNGRKIYRAFYQRSLNFMRDNLKTGKEDASVEMYVNARADALERLVDDELIYQQAELENLSATESEIRNAYNKMVAVEGGEAQLLGKLSAEHITRWEAIEAIRKKLAVDRFVAERVTPLQNVSEDEVISYYNKNLARFTPDLWIKLYHILTKCPADADQQRVDAARQRAVNILANLRAGRSFEVMAREFSEDSSASLGGSLGFVKQGVLSPVIDAVAFSIAKDVPSDVIRSEAGFHILKVTERRGGTVKPYAEVRDLCEKAVRTKKQAASIQDLVERLREKAEIDTFLM